MPVDFLFGTAGWSYEDWRGRVYPAAAGSGFDPLAYLCRYFDLVEVNSTFYRLPRPEAAESWLRRTESASRFLFLLKAPQAWTHGGDDPDSGAVETFRHLAGILHEEGRLGALLLQFPWSFRNSESNRSRVARLRERLRGLPVAVEVRHGGFSSPAWAELLRRMDCLPVNVDQPLVGTSLGLDSQAGEGAAYFRLHGRNRASWFDAAAGRDMRYDYLYSAVELEELGGRILLAGSRLGVNSAVGADGGGLGGTGRDGVVFVVANNHYLGQAAANALQLRFALDETRRELPPDLLKHYPVLREIALPCEGDGQGSLFGD